MRLIFIAAFITIVCFACHQSGKAFLPTAELSSLFTIPINGDSLKGVYTGDFNGSPVSIVLHFVSGRHVSGYDIHKGLKRNISGKMLLSGSQVQLDLSEPGTNPYDGTFKIIIDTASGAAKGWWTAFADKTKVVHFTLKKRSTPNDEYNWILLDSLKNSFTFKQDGSCNYSYLADDSASTAQQLTINGNYKIEQDTVLHIFWEPNTVFPSKKSTYILHFQRLGNDDSTTLRSITLPDGREFNELYD